MQAVEFLTELSDQPVVAIPQAIAAQLPKSGQVRVIIVPSNDPDDAEWRTAAYEQFLREDAPEDSVYDKYQ
jgi:hypothetical protein